MKRILIALTALFAVPTAEAMGLAKNTLKYATIGAGGYTILNTIQNSNFGTALLHLIGLQPTGAAQQAQALIELTAKVTQQSQAMGALESQFSAMKHEIGARVVEEAKKHSSMIVQLMKENKTAFGGVAAGLATVGAAVAWQNRLAIANLCVSAYNAAVSTYTAIKVHGIYKIAFGTHEKVKKLEQDVAEVNTNVADVGAKVNLANKTISDVKEQVTDVDKKVVEAQEQITQLETDLKDAIANGNVELARKFKQEIDELKTTLVILQEKLNKLDSIEKQIAEIHTVVVKK